jgi:hypothetical protein
MQSQKLATTLVRDGKINKYPSSIDRDTNNDSWDGSIDIIPISVMYTNSFESIDKSKNNIT